MHRITMNASVNVCEFVSIVERVKTNEANKKKTTQTLDLDQKSIT